MTAAPEAGENRTRIFLAAAIVVGLVGAFFLARHLLFEKVAARELRVATAADHRALEELLDATGIPTRRSSSRAGLPPSDHVVWWLARDRRFPPDLLLDWVEAGGHLILDPLPESDPILDAVGIATFDAEGADDDDHLSRPEYRSTRPDWPKLYLTGETELVAAEGAPDAAWNLTVRVGEGLVTVLNDRAFLANESLGERDHALLAWQLVRADPDRRGIRLVTHDPRPSVWALLGARARPAALALAALVVASLWALARRVGPVRPAPGSDRRHLAEHLRASGEFLWRVGCEDALLEAGRSAVAARLAREGGHLGDRGRKLLAEAAAAASRAGLDPEAVTRALKAREVRDRDRFVTIVRTLEGLRRHRAAPTSPNRRSTR